jgi:hypothetical protein
VVIESDDGQIQDVQDVYQLQRGELKPECLGLTMREAKGTLEGVQRILAAQQVEEYVAAQRCCPSCARQRLQKGLHEIVYRTLFGRLRMESPRLYECRCHVSARKSFSPLAELLTDRTAPELAYLEAKWAALIPFHATSELMAEVLPLGQTLATSSIRRKLHQVAERIESKLGDERLVFLSTEAEGTLPDPKTPLTVGLDGGYVHSCEQRSRQEGWFEVIVGKSVPAEGAAKRFAFVNAYDKKRKRRLFEVLQSQGVHANQPVTFLSDGGETMRNLQMYLNPLAEHLLDWFHVAMRLTVMGQMNKGMRESESANLSQSVEQYLESLKHHLWNGNVGPAQTVIEVLKLQVEAETMSPERKKLLKALEEFDGYIAANRDFIPDYGDRYRNDETTTTAFVESAVNEIVSKRFVKKQQMRWSQKGRTCFYRCERKCSMKTSALRFGNGIQAWTPTARRASSQRSPRFGKVSFFANRSEFRDADINEIMNKTSCLSLLSNAAVIWNTINKQKIVDQLRATGQAVGDEDLTRNWPLLHAHIIPNGMYDFASC